MFGREFIYIKNAKKKKKLVQYLYLKYFFAPKIFRSSKKLSHPGTENFSIHVLTGKRDIVILAWALASLYDTMDKMGQVYIHSDGSLTSKHQKNILKIFPHIQIVLPEQLEGKFEEFPTIKKIRESMEGFFLIRKLVDPMIISETDVRFITDSDVLFFKKPAEVIEAIKDSGNISLAMQMRTECPVFFKDGSVLDSNLGKVNTGIVIYHKKNISLNDIEEYVKSLNLTDARNSHFIEQAGYAYCLKNLQVLSVETYKIKGKVDDKTIVRHYTSPRRHMMYLEGIKRLGSKFL